ncbi:MAG: ComEC family competence protein, partial [candidate division Zixibacteria bacterium]|nr:ComEC family competence protein [candidate division Zixibacteria bacterium]
MFGFRYPAVVVLCFVAAGTIAGRYFSPGLTILSALAASACLALVFAYVRLLRPYFIIPLALVMLFGAWNRAAALYQATPPDDISRIIDTGQTASFFAEITAWPEIKREKTSLTCRVDSAVIGDSVYATSGLVLVIIRRVTTEFAFGDRIQFSGRLVSPRSAGYPGSFDYGRYLRNRSIRGLVYIADPARVAVASSAENRLERSIAGLRRWIVQTFTGNLSAVSAAMATGFLIGETRNIPETLYQSFRRTGTMHLLAVSGSNVALVLAVVVFLIRYIPLGRWPR